MLFLKNAFLRQNLDTEKNYRIFKWCTYHLFIKTAKMTYCENTEEILACLFVSKIMPMDGS